MDSKACPPHGCPGNIFTHVAFIKSSREYIMLPADWLQSVVHLAIESRYLDTIQLFLLVLPFCGVLLPYMCACNRGIFCLLFLSDYKKQSKQ